LNGGLVLGAAALSPRLVLAQPGSAHAHAQMPELGVAKLPVVPAMDQPLREPEVRRSVDGVLSTSLRCAYTYRDIGGMHLYLRAFGPVGRSAVDVRFFHLVTVFWLIP